MERNNNRKKNLKLKDTNAKREASPDIADMTSRNIELHPNPSLFTVYANIRHRVLDHLTRETALVYQSSVTQAISDLDAADADDEASSTDANSDHTFRIPKIVSIGLGGLFELISETYRDYPQLCCKALTALVNLLEGQQPEGMKNEPLDVQDSLYSLLMDIACCTGHSSDDPSIHQRLTSLASAALLSLVIGQGDTEKLIAAVSAMLMAGPGLSSLPIRVPHILGSLQKSILAVLLGTTHLPDWLSYGVKHKAFLDSFAIPTPLTRHADIVAPAAANNTVTSAAQSNTVTSAAQSNTVTSAAQSNTLSSAAQSNRRTQQTDASLVATGDPSDCTTGVERRHLAAMTSDGTYLYIHNQNGLLQVGTGYSGTVKGRLYFRHDRCGQEMFEVDPVSLQIVTSSLIEGRITPQSVLFSDGHHIGHITTSKDDSFVVRTYSTKTSPMTLVSEIPLKLARKCLDTFGASPIDAQTDIRAVCLNHDEQPVAVASGRDFSLMLVPSGKVFYAGKAASLGIKQGSPTMGSWAELAISKSPKVVQISVGHDGQHGLVLTNEGVVYFVGTARRGEDGDSGKARRQPKAVKPKKLSKLDDFNVVQVACNNGTTAAVTKDGELYMFGKDTAHCDHTTGLVSDLKDVTVAHVALGKAHTVILTVKGRVYTMGVNNKGQCGRDFTAGAAKDLNTVTMIEEEDEDVEPEQMRCAPGKHQWNNGVCMVCTICGECTGYGTHCVKSLDGFRVAGQACGCGHGDSGCSECGCCKSCAGELPDRDHYNDKDLIDLLSQSKELNPLDLLIGAGRQAAAIRQNDQLNKKSERMKAKNVAKANKLKDNIDVDPDYSKLTVLAPAEVKVGQKDVSVTQIACGQHHTVLLLQNGEVWTFGSNQNGQLGVGDTSPRGVPTLVELPQTATQVSAGSYSTVILLNNGQVYTCGHHQKGSLGRSGDDWEGLQDGTPWNTVPGPVPAIGVKYGRRATWVSGSGDQTYVRIDESLINSHTLAQCSVFANTSSIGLIPTAEDAAYTIKSLVINKLDGSCKSFSGPDQVDLSKDAVCLDPVYDILWSYSPTKCEVRSYNVISGEARSLQVANPTYCDLFSQQLAIPMSHDATISRSHAAIHILASLDAHTTAAQLGYSVQADEKEKHSSSKVFTKDDYSFVNRFDSHGGGWGYSGHSIEAVRFMVDTDIIIGGYGLFGGRGEYFGRIKLVDLGTEGGDSEGDGETLAETEELPYECGAREKYSMMFEEPVQIVANNWYVAWSRISGPSSDCGSGGLASVTTDDQLVYKCSRVTFKFKSSKKSNNGTDVNAGQIPHILYRLPSQDRRVMYETPEFTEPAHILSKDFSSAVTPGMFDSLLKLLLWSWTSFHSSRLPLATPPSADVHLDTSDRERLIYINCACLRLLRVYITHIYPTSASVYQKKASADTQKYTPVLANIRNTLQMILCDSHAHRDYPADGQTYQRRDNVTVSSRFSHSTAYLARDHGNDTANNDVFSDANTDAISSNEFINDPALSDATNNSKHTGNQSDQSPDSGESERIIRSDHLVTSDQTSCDQGKQHINIDNDYSPVGVGNWHQDQSSPKQSGKPDAYTEQLEQILAECHRTFTLCFHAFYPHDSLKWACLCDLLTLMDPGSENMAGNSRLLAAVMEALCQPTLKLGNILPINIDLDMELMLRHRSVTIDDNHGGSRVGDNCRSTRINDNNIIYRKQSYSMSATGHAGFREIFDRLLTIISLPVRQGLLGQATTYPPLLVTNTGILFSTIVRELASSARGFQSEIACVSQPLLTTPSRFTRSSPSAYWNTGNGSPDAITVSVDRAGVMIAGVNVYSGGGGQYEYELEILDENNESKSGEVHGQQKWNSIQLIKGIYGPEDSSRDTVAIMFDRPVPIKVNTKYALCLKNHGARTINGDGGLSTVKGHDGAVFTFSACSLSVNGTNHVRGQLPQILYYSTQQDGEISSQHSKDLAEQKSRRNVINITIALCKAAKDILERAQSHLDDGLVELLGTSYLFSTLLPTVLAYIAPIAAQDARSAVQVLSLIQDLLPFVTAITCHFLPASPSGLYTDSTSDISGPLHYAIVESDHPYKPATIANYKVTFPTSIQWMVVEFEPQCSTAQVEDALHIYIPTLHYPLTHSLNLTHSLHDDDSTVANLWPVLKPFHGSTNWPKHAIVLPGNTVVFSLETASNYVKDDNTSLYGFRCGVTGYEWNIKPEECIIHLEKEISYLGGMCAACLIKRDVPLPTLSDEQDYDTEHLEETAQLVYDAHSSLLSQGFALSHQPTINQALDGNLPFWWQSNERTFLRDFVSSTPGTSGGRLARWMQLDSYLDPKQCDIVFNQDDVKFNWLTIITAQTRDQYGQLVNCPNVKVEIKAEPVDQNEVQEELKKVRRLSQVDAGQTGYTPPCLNVPYGVTVKDRKDAFHAITMMKQYENFSFEELRYATPPVSRPSENMMVRSNSDGTYTANWTPGSVGKYTIHLTIDGIPAGDVYRVDVKDAPQGLTPPTLPPKKVKQPSRMRKFVAQSSAGLRVRCSPSLQSEQIGIIQPTGVLTFVQEIQNDDGVWVQLTPQSCAMWCTNGYNEAWCLQYNRHLGKTLLVPVDEPNSHGDHIVAGTTLRKLSDVTYSDAVPPDIGQYGDRSHLMPQQSRKQDGPRCYHVVCCSQSGHTISLAPRLKARPLGVLILGNVITVTETIQNADGTWGRLDSDSIAHYCHSSEPDAWTLLVGSDSTLYLQQDHDTSHSNLHPIRFPFNAFPLPTTTPPMQAFDFSTVSPLPHLMFDSPFEVPGSHNLPFTANVPAFGMSYNAPRHSEGSIATPWQKTSPRRTGSLSSAQESATRRRQVNSVTSEILPPELEGVSVKELVKALGESRVNANGPTPNTSPPDSPKPTSSPKICGSPKFSSSPRSSPIRSSSPRVMSTSPKILPKFTSHFDIPSSPKAARSHKGRALAPEADEGTGIKVKIESAFPVSHGNMADSRSHSLPGPQMHAASASATRHAALPQSDGVNKVSFDLPSDSSSRPQLRGRGKLSRTSEFERESPPKPDSLRRSSIPTRSFSTSSFHKSSMRESSLSGSTPRWTARSQSVGGILTPGAYFNIGARTSLHDVSRISPKMARKERTRLLRSKRERAASPAPRETLGRPHSGSTLAHVPVKESLSPSVAECVRAVFAAFIWHEGIVHDAMACSSFLKFNPTLTKDMAKLHCLKTEEKLNKSRTRHPTDSSMLNMNRGDSNVKNINLNLNDNLYDDQTAAGKFAPREKSAVSQQKHDSGIRFSETTESDIRSESILPLTLQHLVFFWEELSSALLNIIKHDCLLPSPLVAVREKKTDKKDKDKDKEKKSKKKREYNSLKGNALDEGAKEAPAEVMGDYEVFVEKETVCELCGGSFLHPVTYHMHQAHPGCGKLACGKGYNSGGNFCGGWAGNCGDGGVGGSSWYLMCDTCRDKYLREKRAVSRDKDKNKKQRKRSIPKVSTTVFATQEPHIVIKNNAIFLLDLASSAGISLPFNMMVKPCKSLAQLSETLLPNVNEDLCSDLNPFPRVPFQYLHILGQEASDSAYADEIFLDQDERVFVRSGSLSSSTPRHLMYRPRLPTDHTALSRTTSLGPDIKNGQKIEHHETIEENYPKSAGTSPDSEVEHFRRTVFQRSVSVFVDGEVPEHLQSNRIVMRRRNNSGGVGDGGMSLLKYPSAAMAKLINSVDKGGSGAERALHRPVMAFIVQHHNLDMLQLAMKQAVRRAACRTYAMQALNWLMRSVTQGVCIHDLLWFYVAAMTADLEEEDETKVKKDRKDVAEDKESLVCEHPLSDVAIAGKVCYPLQEMFHTLLQTVSDVMMHLPAGSPLQQMAMRCYSLKFNPRDHEFLHRSQVFTNISHILTKSDEALDDIDTAENASIVSVLQDLTMGIDVKVSSRQAMVSSLTDNSTETFWESGDEDRNKAKTITLTMTSNQMTATLVSVHVDNSRDILNKVSHVIFSSGSTAADDMKPVSQNSVDVRHAGWISYDITDTDVRVIQIQLKGPDNNLRVRQVKVLGHTTGQCLYSPCDHSSTQLQRKNCEVETLRVFRLLTSQVFGKLLQGTHSNQLDDPSQDSPHHDIDHNLKEHVVGILFSRPKLSHLQKQVCAHIVQAIRKETSHMRDEWEIGLECDQPSLEEDMRSGYSDTYCFELLSMVLALSGSGVGRSHLSQQSHLIHDLFSLLHTGTPRIQRQVVDVLRRILQEVQPQSLATLMAVTSLPPTDYSIVSAVNVIPEDVKFDVDRASILDVLLACIAKALTVQTKVKASGSSGQKVVNTVTSAWIEHYPSIKRGGSRWWLRGSMSTTLASSIIQLLQDMASGLVSPAWTSLTKAAIADVILSLTRVEETSRLPDTCITMPSLWLALASLCVLDNDHVEKLSSGHWVTSPDGQHGQPRPTCDNHDDGVTLAVILCSTSCGNLCSECDHYLHLHRSNKLHQRQVFKEEEEAIKVDLHEGCGRIKLFWLMALSDSRTLKAIVEFREAKVPSTTGGAAVCRFCGCTSDLRRLSIYNVCTDADCQALWQSACHKSNACGHPCGGIKDEDPCLPCLHRCNTSDQISLKQDADDMCMICFTDALSAAPVILLHCGHAFHYHCTKLILEKKWSGPRITFGFSLCPICKRPIEHPVLYGLLEPIRSLYNDVERKALMRLDYEGGHKTELEDGAKYVGDPSSLAMGKYAYYVCYKCQKAYYGGEARCEEQAAAVDNYDPAELVCGACSDVSRAQMCPKHGADFLEYKCRYCCSVAVFFCFGTTHFCSACHDDFQHVTNIPLINLRQCPTGPRGKALEGEECPLHVQHPPTGQEFALGCGVCRNAHTF